MGPARAPLDLAKALDLVDGDREFLKALADLFLQELPARRTALHTALAAGDAAGVGEAAHALKGSLANLGATPAQELAYALEAQARGGDLGAAPATFRQLDQELQRVAQFLATLNGHR